MMKTLFLDLDGSVFSNRMILFHPLQRTKYPGRTIMPDIVTYWKMDDIAVYMLNFLYELEPFDTVLSGSWRTFCTKEQIEDLFETNGLILSLSAEWKTSEYIGKNCMRSFEIKKYINENNIIDYLIINDADSGASLLTHDEELRQDRIYIVDVENGISRVNFLDIVDAFIPKNYPSYYREFK